MIGTHSAFARAEGGGAGGPWGGAGPLGRGNLGLFTVTTKVGQDWSVGDHVIGFDTGGEG